MIFILFFNYLVNMVEQDAKRCCTRSANNNESDVESALRIFANNLVTDCDVDAQLLEQVAKICKTIKIDADISAQNKNKALAKLSFEVHGVIHPHGWICDDCDIGDKMILDFHTRHFNGTCKICTVERLKGLGFNDEEVLAGKAYCEHCDGQWLIDCYDREDAGIECGDDIEFVVEALNDIEDFREIFDQKVESTSAFAKWFYETQTDHDAIPYIKELLDAGGSWDDVWTSICTEFVFACGRYIFHRH